MLLPFQIADTIPYAVTLVALFIAQLARRRRAEQVSSA
jgi:ABC-type uncharacterized transport system permease subunit